MQSEKRKCLVDRARLFVDYRLTGDHLHAGGEDAGDVALDYRLVSARLCNDVDVVELAHFPCDYLSSWEGERRDRGSGQIVRGPETGDACDGKARSGARRKDAHPLAQLKLYFWAVPASMTTS